MAAPFITVTLDTAELDQMLAALQKPMLDAVVAKALSDTTKNAKVKAQSIIAKRMGVKVGTVRPLIETPFVKVGDYQAHVLSSRKPIPLINFPSTRANATGVSTRAFGFPQNIRSAFIATMPTGHRGVYRRTSASRFPIKELWGPTIAGTFATPDVATVLLATMKQRLVINLRRRINSAQRRRR